MKQSQRSPMESLRDFPALDIPPTMKEFASRCKVVRVGDAGAGVDFEDVHRNIIERHYLHAWSCNTLMFAVVVDNFHIAAAAVFGIGASRFLPSSLVDGWTWVDKDRGGQLLELQRMMAQQWAPKGMVSWFLRRCRMQIREYYPKLRATVVYVAPGAVDRWTEEKKDHTGKTYARYCRAKRIPDTGASTEYYINGVWVDGRQMNKIRYDEWNHIAGGVQVGDPNPDAITRRRGSPKRRFIWFENCDPRHLKLKKPLIDYTIIEQTDEGEVISLDYTPTEWEIESGTFKQP